MSDDFKARDVQFFSNFKKVKFKSYNVKNCRLSQSEMIKIIETYRYRPFNDRIAYLEVYTSNKIEGNTLTKGQTKAVLEGIAQDADLRSQTEVIQLNRAIRDNFSINNDLTAGASPRPTLSDIICTFKSITTRLCNKRHKGNKIFQTSFYDHIIRGQEDFKEIWEYIDGNPQKWREDRFYKGEKQ